MPSTAFVDETVSKEMEKINSKSNNKLIFPEHDFYIACINIGLTIQDLKYLTYIDVLKMLICLNRSSSNQKENTRMATQDDIDRLLS